MIDNFVEILLKFYCFFSDKNFDFRLRMPQNCINCSFSYNYGFEFLQHLKAEENCRLKFSEKSSQKDPDLLSILLREFICLFCSLPKGKKLKVHLHYAKVCRLKFCRLFNMPANSCIEKILRKRGNLCRKFKPSRMPENRRAEVVRAKVKKAKTYQIGLLS